MNAMRMLASNRLPFKKFSKDIFDSDCVSGGLALKPDYHSPSHSNRPITLLIWEIITNGLA